MTDQQIEEQVAIIEGPNGKAEIIEKAEPGKPMAYYVSFGGKRESYRSLGEAYIIAGELVGNHT